MSCISLPEKIYFKQGCLSIALDELKGTKRAFLIGNSEFVESKLNELDIQHITYSGKTEKCMEEADLFEPDVVIAIGGKAEMQMLALLKDKGVYLVAVPTENDIEMCADMVIIDRSDKLPLLELAFEEMFA